MKSHWPLAWASCDFNLYNLFFFFSHFSQVEGKCKQYFLGSPGIIGNKGDPGPMGVPGPKGIRGDRGPKGFSYITEPFPLFGQKGRKGEPGIINTHVAHKNLVSVKSWLSI